MNYERIFLTQPLYQKWQGPSWQTCSPCRYAAGGRHSVLIPAVVFWKVVVKDEMYGCPFCPLYQRLHYRRVCSFSLADPCCPCIQHHIYLKSQRATYIENQNFPCCLATGIYVCGYNHLLICNQTGYQPVPMCRYY